MPISDIATPDWIRSTFLFGIDLTDDQDNPFPDEMFYLAVQSAVRILEAELGVVLDGPFAITGERHDVSDWESDTYYLFSTKKRPLAQITGSAVRFGRFNPATLPTEWMHISSREAGQVQIIPGPEGLEGWSFSGGVPLIGIDALTPRPYTPLWLVIDYVAGFESALTGTVDVAAASSTVTGTGTAFASEVRPLQWIKVAGQVRRVLTIASDTSLTVTADFDSTSNGASVTLLDYPADILDAVGIMASMLPLDTAGDLIIGAGISSLSVSVDGLSESIGTTSGIENSGYGARVIQYRKRLHALITSVRRRYHAIEMIVI